MQPDFTGNLEVANKCRDDLLDMRLRVEQEIDRLRGLPQDEWCVAELRACGRTVQAIQIELGKHKARSQAERERRFERAFVDIVRTRMERADFDAICGQAWEAAEPADGGAVPVLVTLDDLRALLTLARQTADTLEPDEDAEEDAIERRLVRCVDAIECKLGGERRSLLGA